ncbi:nuclease-related domain-containing protein [Streptomyces sp. NPDC014894]|uniref:nuclease-related domain-containing protein n=1 Tax=Streptomyces sp. NPDC014894 TaxID=3364931 RepID=UPI0036F79A38
MAGRSARLLGVRVEKLRVTAWKRYGHDRLYVNLPDGTSVAWADRRTGEVTFLTPHYRDTVLDALARHAPADPAPPAHAPDSSVPPPRTRPAPLLPPLTPENDLARRRPGAALRELLAESGPGPLERLLDRLLRRRSEWDSWRQGLAGERLVGAELNRLTRRGWHVLHSVPLPREVDIDHLLIGPGGVFSVNAKHHNGKPVRVDQDTVRIGDGPPHPYLVKSRSEARRVRAVLERFCPFDVPVQPVLVFVGVTALDLSAAPPDVRVYRQRHVSALGPLSGALTSAQSDQIFDIARDRRAWLSA